MLAASLSALAIKSRTVWPRLEATSLPRAMMRILPSSISLSPNGGAAQPTSIWPDMTEVSVAGGLPVFSGLALMPWVLIRPSTRTLVEEPVVE